MSIPGCKETEEDKESVGVSELINNRLYFVTYKNKRPESTATIHYFTFDDELERVGDSGGYNLVSVLVMFLQVVNNKLSSTDIESKTLVFFSTGSNKRRSDATLLVGVYSMVYLNLNPIEASEKLVGHTSIKLTDNFNAIFKAIQLGFINFEDFNLNYFNDLDKIKLNWVVPNKIMAFSGPSPVSEENYQPPKKYIKYFQKAGVSTLVRIGHLRYNANPFVNTSFDHYDLNTNALVPSEKDMQSFLEICECSEGVTVIHCRNALGCGGSLICSYIIKHYCMSAEEAVAWVRFISPNYFLESQREWLKKKEKYLQQTGISYRLHIYGDSNNILPHQDSAVYSYSYPRYTSSMEEKHVK